MYFVGRYNYYVVLLFKAIIFKSDSSIMTKWMH